MSNVDVNYAMFNLGTGELVLIFLVILLLFGAKRLPELARGLGKGINEFKDGVILDQHRLKEQQRLHHHVHSRPIIGCGVIEV